MDKERLQYATNKLKALAHKLGRVPMISEFTVMLPNFPVSEFGTYENLLRLSGLAEPMIEPNKLIKRDPRIGILDIETKPIKAWVWGTFDQNIGLDMIIEDWSVMSWAFKWVGNDNVIYQDLSKNKDYTKDELIICGIWELLDQADVIITQNGIKFDIPKLNGKFLKYKLGPPSPYKHIDTMRIKRKLGLTSKKLAYSTEYYNEKYKKLKHGKFPGMSLWTECLNGNQEAWKEMKDYNIHDVLALEELYLEHLISFDNTINYGVYTGASNSCPNCGSDELTEREFTYTKSAVFKNYQCKKCKTHSQARHNELSRASTKGLMK
jgi:hypothetical protein